MFKSLMAGLIFIFLALVLDDWFWLLVGVGCLGFYLLVLLTLERIAVAIERERRRLLWLLRRERREYRGR